jgi:hypothetical protein
MPVGADVHVRAKSLTYQGLNVSFTPNRLKENLLRGYLFRYFRQICGNLRYLSAAICEKSFLPIQFPTGAGFPSVQKA